MILEKTQLDDNDKKMMAKGYQYLIQPTDLSFDPLYVKTVGDIAQLMRDTYKNHTFHVLNLHNLQG